MAPSSQGVTLALDASAILSEAQAAAVHIALHGHQHKAKLATYMDRTLARSAFGRPIHVVSNGSSGASADRLPNGQNNTYCIFKLDENDISVIIREIRTNAQSGAELFNGTLGVTPITAPQLQINWNTTTP
jgi:hypothetical protein